MGMLHYQPEAVSLARLIADARAIALVRPAAPGQRVVQRTVAAAEGAPRAREATYAEAYDRFEVIEWLRALPASPTTIEVASPHNAAASRDAHDLARGMFGHVHHVLLQSVVDVPAAWRALPDERRLLFLAPVTWTPMVFGLVHDTVLGPDAVEPVRAAVAAATPPPTPARRRQALPLVGAVAVVALVVAIATRAAC